MTTNDLLQLISFLTLFISLILVFFLFTVKSKNKIGNYLLAFYLLINAIDISSFFYHNYVSVHPTLEMLRIEMGSFLPMPLLFLFVLSIIYSDFKLKYKHLLHLVPILLSTIVLLPNFYLSEFQSKILFFENHSLKSEGIFSAILTRLQTLFYIIAIFISIKRYRRILLENFSISDHFNYKWLFQMNVILSFLFVVATIKNLLRYTDYSMGFLRLSTAIVILIFTCWLVLKALYAPRIFKGIDSHLQLVSKFIKNDGGNITSIKSEEDSRKSIIILDLKEHMINKEPYLNPELTIQELANQISVNVKELSIIINRNLNQNFYEFISHYRIDKAQEILMNPEYKSLTILEILYQIGFNSKSSFNKSFKDKCGMTPTEFRNKSLK